MNNAEFISQARKLLNENYKSNHSAEYNSWLGNQQNSWMQPHVIVPFPPFVVSSALAPFTPTVSAPTEQDVVAKALELYNQFNTVSAPVAEPVIASVVEAVREPITNTDAIYKIFQEPVAKAPVVMDVPIVEDEPLVEEVTVVEDEPVVEPTISKTLDYVDPIRKIFQSTEKVEIEKPAATDTTLVAMEQAFNAVPQPAEELAKAKNSGGIFPTVLEKFHAMTSKWSTKGQSNV